MGGFRVVAAASTEAEANLWLEDNPGGWDLAIVDLVLDQGAGMNVIRRCKADPNGGRIAVFSSYATPGVRQHCIDLGADEVFDKSETERFIAWCGDLKAGVGQVVQTPVSGPDSKVLNRRPLWRHEWNEIWQRTRRRTLRIVDFGSTADVG